MVSTTCLVVQKSFLRTSSLMPLGLNKAAATADTPGVWLLSPEIAKAVPFPTLIWKWMSPRGNTNKSPFCMYIAKSVLLPLLVMNPIYKLPSTRSKISVALGCT